MGCASSTEHPSIYKERVGKQKEANGTAIIPTTPRYTNAGDYSQYVLARHNRTRNQKNHQMKTMFAADQMAERLIEERELLSLGARSRGTSRNTSRTTSPNGSKRNQNSKPTKEDSIPMTPVAELTRSESLKRDKSNERQNNEHVQSETPRKHKKSKRIKTKGGKTKKHKKSKGANSKSTKNSKLLNNDNVDSGMDEADNICDEAGDVQNHVDDGSANSDPDENPDDTINAAVDGDTSALTGEQISVRADSISATQRDSALAETDGTNQLSGDADSSSPDAPV